MTHTDTATAAPKAHKPIKAAKSQPVVHKTKAEAAMATKGYTLGYNLKAWPKAIAGPAPGLRELHTARAIGPHMYGPVSKGELAVAAYLRDCAAQFNVYDVGVALETVMSSNGGRVGTNDHKMNVVNQKLLPARLVTLGDKVKVGRKGETAKVAYALKLTAKGQAKLDAYVAANALGHLFKGEPVEAPKVPPEPVITQGEPVDTGARDYAPHATAQNGG